MDNQQLKDPKSPSGPVVVRNLRFQVDRDLCIGAATCIAIAPRAWALDNEAKAIILDTCDQEDDKMLIEAAKGCPVLAIFITTKI